MLGSPTSPPSAEAQARARVPESTPATLSPSSDAAAVSWPNPAWDGSTEMLGNRKRRRGPGQRAKGSPGGGGQLVEGGAWWGGTRTVLRLASWSRPELGDAPRQGKVEKSLMALSFLTFFSFFLNSDALWWPSRCPHPGDSSIPATCSLSMPSMGPGRSYGTRALVF